MSQRHLVIASVALTALGLLGVAVHAGRARPAPSDSGSTALPPDREAAYRALIAEANARIEAQNRALRTRTDPAPVAAPEPIGAEAAGRNALARAPNARLIAPPELVSYQGRTAYEARLDLGTIYVDAYAGQILHDGTARPEAEGAGSERWLVRNDRHERRHGREHHEEDDDD